MVNDTASTTVKDLVHGEALRIRPEKKTYCLYKRNKGGTGSVSQWELTGRDEGDKQLVLFFITMANQLGTEEDGKQFDYENKIMVKLGLSDIGEILTVLNGLSKSAGGDKGLYHQNEKGNATIKFRENAPEYGGYWLEITKQSADKTMKKTARQPISFAEGEILKVLLERAAFRMI